MPHTWYVPGSVLSTLDIVAHLSPLQSPQIWSISLLPKESKQERSEGACLVTEPIGMRVQGFNNPGPLAAPVLLTTDS